MEAALMDHHPARHALDDQTMFAMQAQGEQTGQTQGQGHLSSRWNAGVVT